MDWKFIARSTLAWADGYEDAEAYGDDSRDDDDETVQDLITAHELWIDMLKSWAGTHTQSKREQV